MSGFVFYMVAAFLFMAFPMSIAWAVALGIGMLIHWKFWTVGIVAFLVGAGWKKPF